MDGQGIDDITFGLEFINLTQEQVVRDFRALAATDLVAAAIQYDSFTRKLESASSRGDAQVRSLVGGPDSTARAELIDILAQEYVFATDETKERILAAAVEPLKGDNSFYVQLAIVRMKNPYVIADIIRKHPIFNPGADFYEQDLLQDGNLTSPGSIQDWLDKFGDSNFFAAMAVALQRSNPTDIGIIIEANRDLFEGAAHIVASNHDTFADRMIAKDPTLSKSELLQKYRRGFIDEFAVIIREKADDANWLGSVSL